MDKPLIDRLRQTLDCITRSESEARCRVQALRDGGGTQKDLALAMDGLHLLECERARLTEYLAEITPPAPPPDAFPAARPDTTRP